MSERYGKQDAECATVRLAAAVGLAVVSPQGRARKMAEDCGVPIATLTPHVRERMAYTHKALTLDIAYGGYQIELVGTNGTGVDAIVIERSTARELCWAVRAAENALRLYEGKS